MSPEDSQEDVWNSQRLCNSRDACSRIAKTVEEYDSGCGAAPKTHSDDTNSPWIQQTEDKPSHLYVRLTASRPQLAQMCLPWL